MTSIRLTRNVKEDINICDITHSDIMAMSHYKLKQYANQMRIAMFNTTHEEPVSTEHPQAIETKKTRAKVTRTLTQVEAMKKRVTGKKLGKTSKYHYVHFNSKLAKWKGALKIDGVSKYFGDFDDEREAALAVDNFLNSISDTKRPRNYIEFPEIVQNLNNKDNK